jgi:phenylalanyl-tRNA synthetase beta chain
MMANSITTALYVKLSTMLKEEHNVTMLKPLSNDLSTCDNHIIFRTRGYIIQSIEKC